MKFESNTISMFETKPGYNILQCGHCEIVRSVVCSVALHSQFENVAKPHICINKQLRPTSERRRFEFCLRCSRHTDTHKSAADPGYEKTDY